MKIFWMVHQLFAPSELWMLRMIDLLGDHVAVVAYAKLASGHAGGLGGREMVCHHFPSLSWARRFSYVPGAVMRGIRPSGWHMRKLIRDSGADVILIHFASLALGHVETLKASGLPVWIHCHGMDVTFDLRQDGRPVHPPDYASRIRALADFARFIANSHATRRKLEAIGVPAERIHVKYFGVPPEAPPEVSPEVSPEASESFTPPSEVNEILFLGRLVDVKGPIETMKAFDLAKQQGLPGRLTLAGDGPLAEACRRLQADLKYGQSIDMPGVVSMSEGVQLRKRAQLFTAHSQKGPQSFQEEAFGVAFLEAQSAGLPVVTGRSGGIPEIVEHGKTGLLFTPGDIEAHARMLLTLANDHALRQAMSRNAARRVRDCFTPEQEKQRFLEILAMPGR